MNAGGALSGVLPAHFGYGGLNAVAAAPTVPVPGCAAFVLLRRAHKEDT